MKNSLKPTIWGPHGWKFLHYVSLGYPEKPTMNDKNNYKNFYYSLQYILPCEKCTQNYQKNISEYPIDNHLSNKDSTLAVAGFAQVLYPLTGLLPPSFKLMDLKDVLLIHLLQFSELIHYLQHFLNNSSPLFYNIV